MNTNNKTVYISNLSFHRDQTGIKNLFSRYGKIKNVTIILNSKTKLPTGMAFVEMGTEEQALLAIKGLNEQIIDGRTLKTKFAFQQRNPENNTFKPKNPPKVPSKSSTKNAPKSLSKKFSR
jgi:RNA recognition motif-containing protein